MITGAYAREMARYNNWENNQLATFLQGLSPAELTQQRGAFFGSILGTANHLLWGDWIWMSRFDKGNGPESNIHRSGGGIPESVSLCPDLETRHNGIYTLALCHTLTRQLLRLHRRGIVAAW